MDLRAFPLKFKLRTNFVLKAKKDIDTPDWKKYKQDLSKSPYFLFIFFKMKREKLSKNIIWKERLNWKIIFLCSLIIKQEKCPLKHFDFVWNANMTLCLKRYKLFKFCRDSSAI